MIGNRRLGTALPVLLIFALLAAGDLASGGIIVKYYVHDMFVLFDAMWRGSLGQTPHIDFHTPIGQAYYWPFRLLGAFGDHDALSIIHAHVLVGALLTAGMLATLQRRLSPALLMAAAFTLLALAMTPRDIDHGITGYSWLAPYNRWSWAILLLAALVAALPPQRERRWIDGIVLGVAIALLFYMKLTFFVAAVGLVVVGLVLRQLAWPTALIALAVCLACALGVEATWHNHAAYLADLRMAFHASAGAQNRLGLYKLLRTVRLGAGFGMLVVAILWLWRPMLSPWRWLILWWKPLLLSAAIIGAGLFVTIQNHPNFEFAHGVIAVLVAIELARRRDPERPMAWRKGALVALAALAMILPAMDAASIFAHAIESRGNHICPVPALAGTPGAALLEPASPSGICSVAKAAPSADIATFDYQKIERAMDLLERHARAGDVILTLDFANPYPFFRRAAPPEGALIWWHLGRDYSEADHPSAAVMLQSATLVLQTRYEPPKDDGHGAAAWAVYGSAVERLFVPVAENDAFRLWRIK